MATFISVAVGIPLGTLMALRDFRGKKILSSLVNFGMGLPPVVATLIITGLSFAAILNVNPKLKFQLLSLGAEPFQVINLLIPFDGELKLFGENVQNSNKTKLRRQCSYVFQEMLLLKDTVFNNVAKSLQFSEFS